MTHQFMLSFLKNGAHFSYVHLRESAVHQLETIFFTWGVLLFLLFLCLLSLLHGLKLQNFESQSKTWPLLWQFKDYQKHLFAWIRIEKLTRKHVMQSNISFSLKGLSWPRKLELDSAKCVCKCVIKVCKNVNL